jgi:thymidylate synthase (FAD)
MTVEELKWKKFPVLNDGFVCLVDIMGDDAAVVQAARTSYGSGTKIVSDDRSLLRYLMRHYHTTPFEMVEMKFMVRVPMDTWRQWIRHRTASVNEYSTRYSEAIDSQQTTMASDWRSQSTDNKQGSSGYLPAHHGQLLSLQESSLHDLATTLYQQRLKFGVAREQARKDLPLSTYTEAYWKLNLHNLLHFLYLRMEEHAQKEIRDYATVIGEQIVSKLLPNTWEAFEDYRRKAVHFSRLELIALKEILETVDIPDGLVDISTEHIKNKRERAEAIAKIRNLLIRDVPEN